MDPINSQFNFFNPTKHIDMYMDEVSSTSTSSSLNPSLSSPNMKGSVMAVENIINYRFKNKRLLEEALTHPSYPDSASYQRLEFLGDSALNDALSNHVFLAYPDLDPGHLSLIRAANISTEKLARVAIRHGLYRFLRHNAPSLDEKITEFAKAVRQEDDAVAYGGSVKAPKVLADIVESVAAAILVDVNFDLQRLWVIFRGLLEPIVTHDDLKQQPQPVTMLFELCQKRGKQVDIKHWRKGIDGKFEIEAAKQKLHELCGKKKWPKPTYSIEKDAGPAHEKKFVCAVQIATMNGVLYITGDEKSRIKDAENSAASLMIRSLQESNYL
ncbi:Ribonuclease 3-like protein 2 [Quillaja saponaria]|uniref:Ribonuclease 3-like protein 2 n=1 Tax=Quillaja saponaria TaxID=32244 RepID=A0AAD7PQV0_QUISA|nr:Ribonuclease 3-like protein 2 [Quillaja saponaria]